MQGFERLLMTNASKSTTVVVGGGIAGLLAALLKAESDKGCKVLVVEKAPHVGGLLGRVDGGEFGLFDLGMHTVTQTGVENLDRLLWSLLPDHEWYSFGGAKRDISGTFFQGKLQRHAHYPDLRSLPEEDYRACLVDLLEHLQKETVAPQSADMRAFAEARFGTEITDRVIEPIMERTYGCSAQEIHSMAAALLRLDRVVVFNERLFGELMASPTMRACIAYPEQRNLDLQFASGAGSYYPKNFGIYRVIDALKERCRAEGVEFALSTQVQQLHRDKHRIVSLRLTNTEEDLAVSELLWTGGVVPLARQLEVFPEGLPSHPPLTTAVINFLFDHPSSLSDLYYFYCLDPRYRCYRVTNYTAYCPGAPRAGGWPISIELLLPPGHSVDPEALKIRAEKEIKSFGILPPATRTLFSHTTVLQRGFPLPSIANMELIEKSRESIEALNLDNLKLMGVLSKPGLFFQTDVLRDVYKTLVREAVHAG